MGKTLLTEKERLQFSISRYDHYYDSINNKSNVYLAISTFAIGALATLYAFLTKQNDSPSIIYILLDVLILISGSILFFVIKAATPKLSKPGSSLIYFRSISKMGQDQFCQRSITQSEEEETQDLRNQAYELAKGLTEKFCWLRYASWLFMGQIVLSVFTIILAFTLNTLKTI